MTEFAVAALLPDEYGGVRVLAGVVIVVEQAPDLRAEREAHQHSDDDRRDEPQDQPRAQAHRYAGLTRSEEHTSELQSLMRISYAVFCLKKKKKYKNIQACKNSTI